MRGCSLYTAILLLVGALGCEGRQGSLAVGGPGLAGAGTGGATGGASFAGAPGAGVAGSAGAQQMDPLAEPEPDPNQVPFECQPGVPALGPRRIVRLNAAQFGPSLAAVCDALDISVPAGVAPPFDYVNVADRFSTFSRSYGMNDAELQSAWDMASYAADAMAGSLMIARPCLTDAGALSTCVAELAADAARAAYRRPLGAEELSGIAKLAQDNAAQLGTQQAIATLLHFVLMSPEFLFRSEVGDVAAAAGDAVPLTPEQQAAAASFVIENKPPDADLVAAAMAGPTQLASAVAERLANMHQLPSVPLMIREYFRYPQAVSIFKDPAILPDVHRVDLVKDTDTLVSKVLEQSGHSQLLQALLTAQDVWVSQDTHEWYGITQETKTHEKQLRTPPPGTRLGILTQPSFLIHYSDMVETKPVQRGRFVLESLLCTTVPELPIGVVPALPDLGANATQRERLVLHTEQLSCQGCHRLMDPVGLAFEQFDEYGRFRADQNGKALDLNGNVSTAAGDLSFTSALDLIGQLAESELAEQCFVRHTFRFFMGRNERDADGCALVAARDAYRASGGDYAALVAALFSSESFLKRSAAEEQ
jgi:hypothetical protein